VNQTEMSAFAMPPTNGYVEQKEFTYAGDYLYLQTPMWSSPGDGVGVSGYNFIRYTGVSGKHIVLYGYWGGTEVPPPAWIGGEFVDSCAHAHTSYGVWARRLVRGRYGWSTRWTFEGGGGMSGVRTADGRCVGQIDNPLAKIDTKYGWGVSAVDLDLRAGTNITDLVLGVQSNTHGWGSCTVPAGSFLACIEPSWAIAYTTN